MANDLRKLTAVTEALFGKLPQDVSALDTLARAREELTEQIHRRVLGQNQVIEQLLICLFAGGHGLFIGVPGLAKTLLVQSLADSLALEFSRIQFTPDLMPTDITGSEVLDYDAASGKRSFRFVPGPLFCNLLLADEVNRTPPKTQAALLQAMQESKVTAAGQNHALPLPFHVFATQNPIEQEGTYTLPEAQLDRFMMQIRVAYPDEKTEQQIVAMAQIAEQEIAPVLSPAELTRHQALVRRIPVAKSVIAHVVSILKTSRPQDETCTSELREQIRWGAGPRAGQQLVAAAQARAALQGRPAATIEDVRSLAVPVLEHRIVPSFSGQAQGVTGVELVERILESVPL